MLWSALFISETNSKVNINNNYNAVSSSRYWDVHPVLHINFTTGSQQLQTKPTNLSCDTTTRPSIHLYKLASTIHLHNACDWWRKGNSHVSWSGMLNVHRPATWHISSASLCWEPCCCAWTSSPIRSQQATLYNRIPVLSQPHNWRAPWKNRIFLFSAHHSMVFMFYFRCSDAMTADFSVLKYY